MKTYSELVGRGEKHLSKREKQTAKQVRSKYNVSKNNDQLLPKPKPPLDAKPKPKPQPKSKPKTTPKPQPKSDSNARAREAAKKLMALGRGEYNYGQERKPMTDDEIKKARDDSWKRAKGIKEGITYEMFVEATEGDLKAMGASASQIAMLKKRQEKRGKGFSTGDDRVSNNPSKSTPKALPGGSALAKKPETRGVGSFDKPGALVKSKGSAITKPADKGTAIVRQKKNNMTGQAGKEPIRRGVLADKPYDKPKGNQLLKTKKQMDQEKAKRNKRIKDAKDFVVDRFKDAVKMTSKAGPGVADSKDLAGAKRGIYNPK